jgi:DNA-binding PadR family transcriptional regulator
MNRHVFEVSFPEGQFGPGLERLFGVRSRHGCGNSATDEGREESRRSRRYEDRRSEARFEGRGERHGHGCGGREHHSEERGFRGRHGGFEGGFGRGSMRGFERGGGGRGRMFDAGDIKLVILKLLSEQPSYGYQLIKTMEERLSGGYTPSAGVIYPTLTMLEEEGLAVASVENNKKVYSVTAEGTHYLETNKRRVDELFERLQEAGKGFERGRSPELMKAFMELREAVAARVFRQSATPEQLQKVTDAIRAAAKAIDEL